MRDPRRGSSRDTRTLALPPAPESRDEDGLADRGPALDRVVRRGGPREREALADERRELAARRGRQRALLEVAHTARALQDPRADGRRHGQAAREEVAGVQPRRRTRGEAEEDQPAPGPEELERGAAELAADAVKRDGDLASVEGRAHGRGPVLGAVVDGDRAELAHPLGLCLATGGADDRRARVARGLHEQAAQAAGRGGDERDVV